jgi:uncharacterized iron-regulated membrane protein
MSRPSKQQLRQLWLQVHKWIGLTLAILIVPISLTGAALVWHDALDEVINPQRVSEERPALTPSVYATTAVREAATGEKLVSLAFPTEAGPITATLAQPGKSAGGRPVRTLLYLDPTDAKVVDRTTNNAGLIRVMHQLHGSLMVPGVGRQIVGWIGVAMLISSLTGLWLWWPLKGGFRRGLRWQRQPTTSANLHHLGGFWICLPLAVLSATGAWISFPAFFAQISSDPAGPSAAERARRLGAAPIAETRLTPEQIVQLANPHATGPLTQLTWPTEPKRKWKASFARDGGPAEVEVADKDSEVTPPKPPQPETTARLMRRIHDGTDMGLAWQIIIFIGGLIPALLAVTGIMMWLNIRRRDRAMRDRRAQRNGAAVDGSAAPA